MATKLEIAKQIIKARGGDLRKAKALVSQYSLAELNKVLNRSKRSSRKSKKKSRASRKNVCAGSVTKAMRARIGKLQRAIAKGDIAAIGGVARATQAQGTNARARAEAFIDLYSGVRASRLSRTTRQSRRSRRQGAPQAGRQQARTQAPRQAPRAQQSRAQAARWQGFDPRGADAQAARRASEQAEYWGTDQQPWSAPEEPKAVGLQGMAQGFGDYLKGFGF